VRHELCHALVAQDDLLDRPTPAVDALAEALFDPDYPLDPALAPHAHFGTEDRRRSEAVAIACEWGPYGAAALEGLACSEPDPDGQPLARWLLDRVWSAFELPDPADPDLSDPIRWSSDEIVELEGISPTDDPDVIVLSLNYGREIHADLWTGAEVE